MRRPAKSGVIPLAPPPHLQERGFFHFPCAALFVGQSTFRSCPISGTAGPAKSADEARWGMSRAQLEKRILSLHKGGTGILKIGKTLGVGTALVQGIVRPFAQAA